MGIKGATIVFLVALAPVIVAWRAAVTVDAGREHDLVIGMEDGASDGFDVGVDKPSPPPPPIGFYCFFSLSDTNYSFIDGLWGDIRPPADSALWSLEMRRWETPATIAFDSLPASGVLSVDGTRITPDSSVVILPAGAERVRIEYSAEKKETVIPK